MSLVADTSAAEIAATLDQVGARLKRLRTLRRMTLTGVAKATGISKSTMSRLETGQRRPTLELLLALSHAYRVPLGDLVAAPEEGDPRIQLKPGRVKGRTDWVLGPGEVASFDTTVPHWFGSTGDEPAEILSIFGRPGERMTVRTTPSQA